MKHLLKIKALSVNMAYRGRRYATPELTKYKRDVGVLLPKINTPTGRLSVKYRFGVSKRTDGDNLVKCFQDILSEKYGFNDNTIYRWEVEKIVVKRGEEFIVFEISNF